jgi:acyl dehydratase
MDKTGRSLGSPGIDELRWKRPVYPGDVLSVRMEVLDLIHPKSRPKIGFVVSQTTTLNQNGDTVMEFISKGIFPRNKV